MMTFAPTARPILPTEAASLAAKFGTKGAFLSLIPPAWTPEFILISADSVERLAASEDISIDIPDNLRCRPVIVRSSIVGETIWDRGTFLSVPCEQPQDSATLKNTILRVRLDAKQKNSNAAVGIIIQRFLQNCTKGTVGNLNRLSRSREHWARFGDVGGYSTAPDRFNSQRDNPADAKYPLMLSSHRPLDRLFGGACRWLLDRFGQVLGRDRMLLEWATVDDKLYLLQCDLDEDNVEGVNPETLPLITKIANSKKLFPKYLRVPNDLDIGIWDKLKILDDLAIDGEQPPQTLYAISYLDAQSALSSTESAALLANDLTELFGSLAIIRASRRAGTDKTHNLPCTSSCLDAQASIAWMQSQIENFRRQGGNLEDRAFIVHKYIGARSGAWALYDPASPYIQVHANWGLPDALQSYPYDAWDVHSITEEITSFPSYKSHFLWPDNSGDWTFRQVKNSIGRHQCLKSSEVLEIARKTFHIGSKLGRRVAVMWFAGVETDSGQRLCIPWYRTFDYKTPDLDAVLSRDHVIVPVTNPSELRQAEALSQTLVPVRRVALDIQPSEHLVRDPSFLDEIIEVAQRIEAAVVYSGSPLAHAYFQLQGKVQVYLRLHRRNFRTRGRIKYYKLVRDLIPDRISRKHERVVYASLKSGEILQLLVGKLIEEAQELIAARGDEATAEELADVYEVFRGMMHQAGVDEARVVEIANSKRNRLGGFEKGIFLLETSLPKPGEATEEMVEMNFDLLIKEEFARNRVRVPFGLLGGLSSSGDRLLKVPGSDQAIRISSGRDGFDLSLEKQERQLEIDFPDIEDDN